MHFPTRAPGAVPDPPSGGPSAATSSPRRARLLGRAALLVLGSLVAASTIGSDGGADRRDHLGPHAWGIETVETVARFEPNGGQFDDQVDQVLRAGAATVFLTGERVVFDVASPAPTVERDVPTGEPSAPRHAGQAIAMSFVGADPAVEPVAEPGGGPAYNYFIGSDRSQWITGQQATGAVTYGNLIGTTDVRFLATPDGFRYDVRIEPGTDPADVDIAFDGASGITLGSQGELQLGIVDRDPLVFSAPRAFQIVDGRQVDVAASFTVTSPEVSGSGDPIGNGTVGFAVGDYDPTLPLVIDPTLDLGSYLGGAFDDHAYHLALDSSDNMIVVGDAASADYPTTVGAYDQSNAGTGDAVVSKLSADGSTLLWSTFIGGTGYETAKAVVVNADGALVVAGTSASTNFPTTAGVFDTSHNGSFDGVVFELAADGATLNASTYLGGAGTDWAYSLDVDADGTVAVGGTTTSSDFPATAGAYDTTKSGSGSAVDGFVAKLTPALGRTWATYLGVFGSETFGQLGFDTTGKIYASLTSSGTMPTSTGAYDTTNNGSYDLWVGSLSADGSAITYGTWLGGTNSESGPSSLVVAADDRIYVGSIATSGFPTTAGAFATTMSVAADTAVAVLDPTTTGSAQLVAATYLGGTADGWAQDLAVDGDGRVYLVGDASAAGLATAGAPQTTRNGSWDGLLAVLNPGLRSAPLITYIGGGGDQQATGVVLDSAGRAVVAGWTNSTDLPTTAGAYDRSAGGAYDAFVYRYSALAPADVAVVNSTGDASDDDAGDGLCSTGATNSAGEAACTLRAAMEEADASSVVDTIEFDIPVTEPGYSPGRGVFTIAAANSLPVITAPLTIHGATQTTNRGDTNPGVLGTVTTVGTGPDGVDQTSDERTIDGVPAPEIEVDLSYLGFRIAADSVTISGLAVFGGDPDLWIESGSGAVVTDMVIGTRADAFADPGAVDRSTGSGGVMLSGGTGATVADNLIGYQSKRGLHVVGTLSDLTIEGNEIRGNGVTSLYEGGGIEVVNYWATGEVITGLTIAGNLIADTTDDAGIEVATDVGDTGIIIEENTFDVAAVGVYGNQNPDGGTIRRNVIVNSQSAGIYVGDVSDWSILQNSLAANTYLGIELGNGNDNLAQPALTAATATSAIVTADLDVTAPAGTYRIELFDNTAADPSGYGEGETFLGFDTVVHPGGTASYTVTVPGSVGDLIAATMTEDLGGGTYGSTSQFSNVALVVAGCDDSDGDGLCARYEDANTDLDANPATSPGPDTDGDTIPDYLDADDDGDGIPTISEQADPNGDGDPRDALDRDRDGQPDWLDVPNGPTGRTVASEQKISSTQGGFTGQLHTADLFGSAVASAGDIDGDGIVDLVVGAYLDDDGGPARGAVHVLFLNSNGTVRAEQKISATAGGFTGPLDDADYFGWSVAGIGDLDGDGRPEIAVGAYNDDDGGPDRGAAYVLFLNSNGTVRAEQKISSTTGGLAGPLDDTDQFGSALSGLGDLDSDGIPDLVAGAIKDDDGGGNRGAAYVLLLNSNGTVRAEQKISSTTGGLVGPIDNNDQFANAVAGLGDLDGDGITELAVGAYFDSDGGSTRGAVYVLFMNANGTVRTETKISSTTGGLTGPLDDTDWFGFSVSGLGDLNLDGTPDLGVGVYLDDDGGFGRGAIYVLTLNANGTVQAEQKISSTTGGLAGPLDDYDQFGAGIAGIGDLDGDGTIGVAVGANADDDGGSSRGAVYVLDLVVGDLSVTVNDTGDGGDAAPGDFQCSTGTLNSEGDPACTLRAAIEAVEAVGSGTISFAVPPSDPGHNAGVWTITPASALPPLSVPMTVDATTQPGYGPTPVVSLDGVSLPSAPGLSITGAGVVLTGLNIRGVPGTAVNVNGATATISRCFIGTNAAGTAAAANSYVGLRVTAPDASISDNLISGNGNNGISLEAGADRAVLIDNTIGTSATGNAAIPNTEEGIEVNAAHDVVIGTPGHGNVISGNRYAGINAWFATSTGVTVQGNLIGSGADGVTPLGNGTANGEGGITFRSASSGWLVGGTGTGAGNVIANNNGDGVSITTVNGTSTAVAIVGNAIHANSGLGTDLGDDGVTVNDAGDSDPGPNGLLNGPLVVSADALGGAAQVLFDLDVPAGNYRVEAFTNNAGADPTGYGEGERFVAATTVTHTGSGPEHFTLSYAGDAGDLVALTATEDLGASLGSTSEFSAIATVASAGTAVDSSGRRSDLRSGGGAEASGSTPGIVGPGFDLTGGAQRLIGPATDITSSALTLSGWVNLDSYGNDPRLVAKSATDGNPVYELLIDNGTGEAVSRIATSGGTVEVRGGSVSLGAWHMLAATWDGASLGLYLDGALVDSSAASGTLHTDLAVPLTAGNVAAGNRGIDGTIDQVTVSHTARSADWLTTAEANLRQPGVFVRLGGEQTESNGPWTTTAVVSHSGTSSLAAPSVGPGGLGAWITASGLDEPGVEFESWWRLSDPSLSFVAAGTRTGLAPTDQYETALNSSGFDLATLLGATRTPAAGPVAGLSPLTWTRITIRTDETGATTVEANGVPILGPVVLSGGAATGSISFRTGILPGGQTWNIDDVRARRLVSDEPATALAALDRP